MIALIVRRRLFEAAEQLGGPRTPLGDDVKPGGGWQTCHRAAGDAEALALYLQDLRVRTKHPTFLAKLDAVGL